VISELAAHLKSSPDARLNLWLGPDRCPGLHDVKGLGFQRSNWTEVCVSHLARENRCPAIVANYDDPMLVKMLAAFEKMPPVIRHPEDQAAASDCPLILFVPASVDKTGPWAEKIAAAAGQHPWVIAGVNEPTREDCEILDRVATSGADIYWVGQWCRPVPPRISFRTKRISGHDPDTFFAALSQALGAFPPVAGALDRFEGEPAEALRHLLDSACSVFSNAADQVIKNWLPPAADLAALSDETFREQMERSRRLRPAVVTLGGENATRKFIFGTFSAGLATGGRRADEFFGWSWAAIDELPASYRLMGFDASEYRIKILRWRARLRTAAGAEPFYEEGQRIIRALNKTPHPSAADLCAAWSEHKPPEAANLLIDQAVQILRKQRDRPNLIHTECRILREHARRLPPGDAQRWLEAAKACADRYPPLAVSPQNKLTPQPFLNPDRSEGMREYYLGLIALDEARLFPDREEELVEAASQYFQTMLQDTRVSPVWVCLDWGVALQELGRTRPNSRSEILCAKAYELLRMSADAGDSANLRTNWSAMLLNEATQTVGARREDLIDEAERHARQAESLQAGVGLYNLARVAAYRRQDKEVMQHLRLCARFPALPARTAFDTGGDFAEIRDQNWFQDLVREIYPG
jgi:hypothetical protein